MPEIRPSSTLNSAVYVREKALENMQEHGYCQQEYSLERHNQSGLECDFMLGDLFEKHPGVQAKLLRLLEDERAADNKFLRRQASSEFPQLLTYICCWLGSYLTKAIRTNKSNLQFTTAQNAYKW